jgi:hypothetical protein
VSPKVDLKTVKKNAAPAGSLTYILLVRKTKGRIPLRRPSRRWLGNNKI